MPLIDVTTKPKLRLAGSSRDPGTLRILIRKVIGPELPGLFARNCELFGMDPDTPEDGIQVTFHEFDVDDINVADIWIKIQFSEEQPDERDRMNIRDEVYRAIVGVFYAHGLLGQYDFVMDVFWGPTHGRGTVNGTTIEW